MSGPIQEASRSSKSAPLPKAHRPSLMDKARLKASSLGMFSGMVWALVAKSWAPELSEPDLRLLAACEKGDLPSIRASLSEGARANAVGINGRGALSNAAWSGSAPCVAELLSAGAKAAALDGMGRGPLWAACEGGSQKCAALLLDAGADPLRRDQFNGTPLGCAAKAGSRSCEVADMEMVNLLMSRAPRGKALDSALIDALREAARTRHLPMVESLLKAGARPRLGRLAGTFDELTADPAQAAVDGNESDARCLRAIIEAGGDLGVRNQLTQTLLMVAAKERNDAGVRELLALGSPVDEVDAEGWTALAYATATGFSECATSLLAARANPNHVDASGTTPAHLSVTHAMDPRVVESMLKAGADPELKDGKGRDMFALARQARSESTLALLGSREEARALRISLDRELDAAAGPLDALGAKPRRLSL